MRNETDTRQVSEICGTTTNLSGQRWLLLHGTPLTPAVWEPTAAHLRGHGAAAVTYPDTTPRPDDRHPQRDVAERIALTLRAAVSGYTESENAATGARARGGDTGWHVVGHSFGGQVAVELSLAHPDLVRSLTVLCARHTPFPPFRQLAAAIRNGAPVDIDATVGRWFRPADHRRRPDVIDYARTCLATADTLTYAHTLDAIAGYDRSTAIGAITVPVTAVGYTDDQVSGPAPMRALADAVANADLLVRTGGHMGPFINPAGCAAVLRHTARRASPPDEHATRPTPQGALR